MDGSILEINLRIHLVYFQLFGVVSIVDYRLIGQLSFNRFNKKRL